MKEISKRRTTTYVEKDLYRKLKIVAANMDKRINECVEEAIKKYIKDNEKYLYKR